MKSPRICPGNLNNRGSHFFLLSSVSCLLSSVFCLLTPYFCLLASAQSQGVRIGAVHFQGNSVFNSDQLQRWLPAGREGTSHNPAALQSQLMRLEEMYRDEGYFDASAGPPILNIQTSGDVKTASILIPIAEGRIFTVGEIQVKNTRVFPSATLLQMCPLSQGQPYKRKQLRDWIDKLKESYREMGYIRFELSSREEIDDNRKVVNLTLDFQEGGAYSVAKIMVEGNPSVNPSEFKKRLLMAEGSLFNPDMISTSLFYINQMRIYGSISESDVEIGIDDVRHTVNITFHLHPDRPAT
jgi:outer membrane protein assembly factor BamA